MNKAVWKYAIPLEDEFTLHLPSSSKELHFGEQGGDGILVLWVLVHPDLPKTPYNYRLAGTGHDITNEYTGHIGTVQTRAGFVWHLFRVS